MWPSTGTLDRSHSSNARSIRTLSGGGAVVLGPTTLVLTAASGTFSGGIYNTYAAGGAEPYPLPTDSPQGYGGVIIAGGVETFSGDNGYAGATGIGEAGRLILTGTLENSAVLNAGYFQNNGLVRGMTTSTGTVGGNGNFAGGLFAASGVVAPGDPRLGTPGHLTVGTGFALGSDTTYLVRSAGANASRIDVEGGRRSRARRSTQFSVRPRNSPSSDKTLPCSPPRTVSSASSAPSTPTWERQRRSFPS
jgi:subtilase-type serine protease